MDDAVAVEISQSLCDIVGDVHLGVVGEGGGRVLQEMCEALIHQLHQEDGSVMGGILYYTQELDDAGMLQISQNVALQFETSGKIDCSWIIISKEDGVEDFSSTGEVIQCCLDNATIGPSPKDLGSVYVGILVAKLATEINVDIRGLCHSYSITKKRSRAKWTMGP